MVLSNSNSSSFDRSLGFFGYKSFNMISSSHESNFLSEFKPWGVILFQRNCINLKDTLIPGMKDEFKKVDGVVSSIKNNMKFIVDMLGGFGLMKTMFFIPLYDFSGLSKTSSKNPLLSSCL